MLLKTTNLVKVFRTADVKTTALNAVSLEIAYGEFTALMGPSGCGKSTLLHILGLIDAPSGGEYLFAGQEVSRLPESERVHIRKRRIGFIFQSFNLIDELTVRENVELPLLYAGTPGKLRKIQVDAVLESLELAHRHRHFPQQLSGGQQQRVAVARAIINEPDLILADEPTGNLDTRNGQDILRTLWQLNQTGKTILMVTQSQADADVCKRIVRMLDGQVVIERETAASKVATCS